MALLYLRIHPIGRSISLMARRTISTKQLQYDTYGDPSKVLKLSNVTISDEIGRDEVLIRWLASPINPADINQIQGVYPIKPPLPAVGGNEGYGRVEETGSGVTTLCPGDHVIATRAGLGCWRQHGIHKHTDVMRIDARLDATAAATMLVNPPTAYRMLADFVDLHPGDAIIQNGANSAVGRAIIQLARERQLVSINLVRDRPNMHELVDELKSLGATHVLSETELMKQRTASLPAPRLALNCVGGRSALIIASSLARDGVMVTYGGMSMKPVEVPTGALIFKNIRIVGYWMANWYTYAEHANERRRMIDELTKLMLDGKFVSPACEHVTLDKYASAIDRAMATSSEKKKQLLIL